LRQINRDVSWTGLAIHVRSDALTVINSELATVTQRGTASARTCNPYS
jgi:hypothetical protein